MAEPKIAVPDNNVAPMKLRLATLVSGALEELKSGASAKGRFVEGRLVRVEASPALGTSSDMVVGVSALPPGFASPAHQHRAEELALVVHGRGEIEIGDEVFPVEAGDAVLTPSNTRHVTRASDDTELVVLWIYAPPGSEARWLTEGKSEGSR